MSTEAQKKASKKYYETHRDYYRQKSLEDAKKVRIEKNIFKKRIDEAIEYIETFSGYDNNFCLDYHELNHLLKILKGSDN